MSKRNVGNTLSRIGSHIYRLLPASERDWARAWAAELTEIESTAAALRWLVGGGRMMARAWFAVIAEEAVMKTVLATLSIINVLMGAALLGLLAFTQGTPPVVAALGIGLLIQAGYTLAYLGGFLDAFEPWSLRALVAGQTVALVVGALGFISSGLYNLNPPGGDYEYGPLTVGFLIALQAAVALWVFAMPRRSAARV